MLHLNIQQIFRARCINDPYGFLVKNGLGRPAARSLLQGTSRTIKFDYIEKLCRILLCEPNDLFVWEPDMNEKTPANMPLNSLRKTEIKTTIAAEMATIPYKQLIEVTHSFPKEVQTAVALPQARS